jgi:hypothetical protein
VIFQHVSIALGVISLIGFFASSGKQKQVSAFLLGFSLLLGIISFSSLPPYSQPPSGQSESQQQNLAPSQPEETRSTERIVVAGRKITLIGDGTYNVPAGKKSLCFENLGMKDGSSMTSQYLTIEGIEYSAMGTECHALPENLAGAVNVDFFPGKEWGTEEGAQKLYQYWKDQPGGQSQWPVIRIGE